MFTDSVMNAKIITIIIFNIRTDDISFDYFYLLMLRDFDSNYQIFSATNMHQLTPGKYLDVGETEQKITFRCNNTSRMNL